MFESRWTLFIYLFWKKKEENQTEAGQMLPHMSYVVKNTDRNDLTKRKKEDRSRLEFNGIKC